MRDRVSGWRGLMVGVVPWVVLAVGCFHAAYGVGGAGILMVGFLYGLVRLSEAARWRWAFYPALLVGILCYGPELWFFTRIFGVVAFSLWTILALPLGAFVLTLRAVRRQAGMPGWVWVVMAPVCWTGWEYFRCEMHYLKFGWMTPGMAMDGTGLLGWLGTFGVAFGMMAWAGYVAWLPRVAWRERLQSRAWQVAGAVTLGLAVAVVLAGRGVAHDGVAHDGVAGSGVARDGVAGSGGPAFTIVGLQMEEPTEREILEGLNRALAAHPEGSLFVMSEYSLAEAPTAAIREWCRSHGRHLIIGGVAVAGVPQGKQRKANTAYVIDARGEIVFQQVKSVPIQFMDDGVPARERRVWESPWGKIGICICYDSSYTRVVDDLVGQGAELLVVPAMDPAKWGAYQHELDARVARVRAAEYHVPVVRVASSGISQVVDGAGREVERAGYEAWGGMVAVTLRLEGGARVPVDRRVAMVCMVLTGCAVAGMVVRRMARKGKRGAPGGSPKVARTGRREGLT